MRCASQSSCTVENKAVCPDLILSYSVRIVTHLLVTAQVVDAFIGNTLGKEYCPKYKSRVTEMLKNHTAGRSVPRCIVLADFYSFLLEPTTRIFLARCWIRFRWQGHQSVRDQRHDFKTTVECSIPQSFA